MCFYFRKKQHISQFLFLESVMKQFLLTLDDSRTIAKETCSKSFSATCNMQRSRV